MIKYLLFVSGLLFLGACKTPLSISSDYVLMDSVIEEHVVNLISVDYDSLKSYNTSIDVYGKYLSGVTYFKNIKDSSLRVLFTTHTGMKLLDLELHNNTCNTIFVVEQINREAVLKLLCHDFSLLTGGGEQVLLPKEIRVNSTGQSIVKQEGEKDLYYYLTPQKEVVKIIETVPSKTKIQTVFKKEQDSSLSVEHLNFKFTMKLKQ